MRIEQLYSFPWPEMRAVLGAIPRLEELVWVQEEPRNMGAWTYVEPKLRELAPDRRGCLATSGGPERASPAEGYPAAHIGRAGPDRARRRSEAGRAAARAEVKLPGDGSRGGRRQGLNVQERAAHWPPSSSAPSPVQLFRQDRPLRCLSGKFLERLREMLSVMQEEHSTRALLHQESDQRRVRLGRVAVPAGQDQIVRPIVRGLAAAGTNVVQGD